MSSVANTIRTFTQRDLTSLTCEGITSRLPQGLTVTLPGASRKDMANYATGIRHDGFGTDSFPMYHNGLKNSVAELKKAFEAGKLEKKHIESLERSVKFVGKAMQRATTRVKDYMTMLFGAMASRDKDNGT